jgi:hypothetical protein
MKNVMLDVESIGFIVQIGAVEFEDSGEIGVEFLENCSIQSGLDAGLAADPNELEWWLERVNLISWIKDKIPLVVALRLLKSFIETTKPKYVYSHGYDVKRLEEACSATGVKMPFSYRQHLDTRTIVHFFGEKKKQDTKVDPKTHNSLSDCIYQVGYISKCLHRYKVLKLKEGLQDEKEGSTV